MSGVKRTVKDYSESTTIHGISYIFESGLNALERLLWICVVCVFLGFAVGLSVQAYINWKDNQVLTTIGTTGYPIEKIEFPAITICAQGMAKEIIDSALMRQFQEYLKENNKILSELTPEETKIESQNFLSSKYPGFKKPPNKLVELMSSPGANPETTLESAAILYPEDEKSCEEPSKRRKRSITCPTSGKKQYI